MSRKLIVVFFVFFFWQCSGEKSSDQVTSEDETTSSDAPAQRPKQEVSEGIEPVVAPEDSARTEWQNPDRVLNFLGDLEGKTVADIGAGSGYFTFKIAREAGKVIALDIDPRALDYINEQIEIVGEWAKNIETRLTPPDVPNLLDDEADVVLIVNTYHFLPDHEMYLRRILRSMRQGGRLVIIDYKLGQIPVGPEDEFKPKPANVIQELRNVGFEEVRQDMESLQYQYLIIAQKN